MGEELRTYFFDTYALIEIIRGSPNYAKYKKTMIITTKMNLLELHHILLKSHGLKIANKYYDLFREYFVEIGDETIKKASLMKLELKNKNLSYIDCLGYCAAITKNALFLTGDKEFKGTQGVEHVK